jgi:CBS domain containing-hemolysin-like protein
MDSGLWLTLLGVLAVPLLVLCNAFFVASEFALVSMRQTRVEEMINAGLKGAKSIKTAIQRLDDIIAMTQLGITLASLALGWIGEPCLARVILRMLPDLPQFWSEVTAHGTATALAFIGITCIHVVLGELAPKAIALQRPDGISLWVCRPLLWLTRLARPFITLLNFVGNSFLRLLGFEPLRGHEMVHSVDELALLVEETRRAGVLRQDQAEYLRNVFRLPAKRVRDCLVPRERMAALELHMPQEKVLEAVRDGAHTRMPVYDGEPNNIVGIVNTKDLFHLFSLQGMIVLDDAMYPPIFVQPDRPISEVLREFRRRRRPMAIVREGADGPVLGIITMEDIVEEIVGEIEDEHDLPSPAPKPPEPRAKKVKKSP